MLKTIVTNRMLANAVSRALACSILAFGLSVVSVLAQAQAQAQIVVEDFLGREVILAQPAERIVALAPHVVENLFSAGAGDKIVAAADWSNFPDAAKQLPRVGGSAHFSVEAIVALQPDLVVAWATSNIGLAATLQQLKALGIAVYIDEPHTLEDVARSINDLGKLAGTSAIATVTTSDYLQRLQAFRQQYQNLSPITVLYQVWNSPLQTINDQHIISDVIKLCGGRNSFADAATLAPKISIEAVIERDPDAIIASGVGDTRPAWLDEWQLWPSLSAVQHNHLYFVPPDYLQRHTVRLMKGAEIMCAQLQQVRSMNTETGL